MRRTKFISICAIWISIFYFKLSHSQELSGLQPGGRAPAFRAEDQFGKEFDLYEELKQGPVVLIFYRGHWCKYCNRYLEQLNDSIGYIIDKGASVITVTPEKAKFIDETSEIFQGSFRIISDEGMHIMEAYKVKFEVSGITNTKYKIWGINLKEINGNNGNNLPVPATYIISKDGEIIYSFYNKDYKKRVPISTILNHL